MMFMTDSVPTLMRSLRAGVLVLVATVALSPRSDAQSLPYALFERYLDALREEAGIPGLSAAIVQGRNLVWDAGLGKQDLERSIPAVASTPYLIGGLTQNFAAVVLGMCVEQAGLRIDQPVNRWTSGIPESGAQVRHLLSHTSAGAPGQAYRFDLGRFAQLTPVADDCADRPFRQVLAEDIFDPLRMADSIPGRDLDAIGSSAPDYFDDGKLRHYESVLLRLAAPYRVDRNRKATRGDYPRDGLTTGSGLVSSVRDLATFDSRLDDNVLIGSSVRAAAWTNVTTPAGAPLPTGLGWFVQRYNGERLVWQFGSVPEVSSALILKVPSRDITLILLANSDGLAPADNLAAGDVTLSLCAKLCLRLFVSCAALHLCELAAW
jgi:CubicO group peptidase (beta-lactamase class C family)